MQKVVILKAGTFLIIYNNLYSSSPFPKLFNNERVPVTTTQLSPLVSRQEGLQYDDAL